MKTILTVVFQLLLIGSFAQKQITGTVQDKKHKPIAGVNIFIENTYEGTTSDSLGYFSLVTTRTGKQVILFSCIGFETFYLPLNFDSISSQELSITLKESSDAIDEVVINAGAFEASDKNKSVNFKVFDIATTPSAQGDIYGALATLPGTQSVGEDGRVFVRGGEAYETKTFMDGLWVATPYLSKMPDIPTRGRFSPLIYSGTLFSTGAYSAEYGQALSSIVDLTTNGLETENKSSVTIMTVGVMGSKTKYWEKASLSVSADFLSSKLNNHISKQRVKWIITPYNIDGTLIYRQKSGKSGMFKIFSTYNFSTSGIKYNNIQENRVQDIILKSKNLYLNSTYNNMLNEKWMLKAGLAFNLDDEKIDIDSDQLITNKNMFQAKLGLTYFLNDKTKWKFGSDFINYQYTQKVFMNGQFQLPFTNWQINAFSEVEYKLTKKFAARLGGRIEHHSIVDETNVVPRFSGAYKTGKHSQVSLAFGTFYQTPEDDYLKFAPQLNSEKAKHAVLTYQYQTTLKTLRIEAYSKNYSNLVKYSYQYNPDASDYNNFGSGYAEGIDFFWRDKESFEFTDYWISYSWVNSKREYKNYPRKVKPWFVSDHNLSVVYKRFFQQLQTYFSLTYSFASSRPYHNPNMNEFMAGRTKPYNDISLGLTYLTRLFNKETVVHLMMNNVTGFDNVFGYNFSPTPNPDGIYEANPIKSPFNRQTILVITFLL